MYMGGFRFDPKRVRHLFILGGVIHPKFFPVIRIVKRQLYTAPESTCIRHAPEAESYHSQPHRQRTLKLPTPFDDLLLFHDSWIGYPIENKSPMHLEESVISDVPSSPAPGVRGASEPPARSIFETKPPKFLR